MFILEGNMGPNWSLILPSYHIIKTLAGKILTLTLCECKTKLLKNLRLDTGYVEEIY